MRQLRSMVCALALLCTTLGPTASALAQARRAQAAPAASSAALGPIASVVFRAPQRGFSLMRPDDEDLGFGAVGGGAMAGGADVGAILPCDVGIYTKTARYEKIWWYGWLGLFGAMALGQYSLAAAFPDRDLSWTGITGGTASLLGVASMFISPVRPWDQVHEKESCHTSTDCTCGVLVDKLRDRRDRQRRAHGMLEHMLVGLVAAAGSTFLAFKTRRATPPIVFGIGSLIVGETRLWTTPTTLMHR